MSYTTETPKSDVAKIETTTFQRISFDVEGIQVTKENFEAVAAWCGGKITTVQDPQDSMPLNVGEKRYIQVDVVRPLNPRQTQAYVGDWVVYASKGFKVYGDRPFRKNFEEKPVELMVTNEPITKEEQQKLMNAAPSKSDIPQSVNNVVTHHHYHGDAQPDATPQYVKGNGADISPEKIQHENHQDTEPAPITSEPGPVQNADGGNWGGHQ